MAGKKETATRECIVIGSGITGLTAAFYLKRKGVDFLVLEKQERTGGVIRTLRENGFLFETGPNTGVLGRPEAAMLFEDLDGAAEMEVASEQVKKRYILKDGQWHALPSGLVAGVKTPLFSPGDKLRILGEPFRPRGKDPHETLEQLVLRRMGRSFLDYAVDPFILGVYAGDPGKLVPKYALPKLYHLEQKYGSFIGGAIKKKIREKPDETERKATREVFSVKGGLQALTEALYAKSGTDRFRLGCQDVAVKNLENGYTVSWKTGGGDHREIHTGHVIVTTGSHSLPALLPDLERGDMDSLTNMRYARVIEVALGFKKWRGMVPDGFGGLIPYREQRDLLGVLFPSAFLEGRAPEGGALFTLFMGGVRRPGIFDWSDDKVRGAVKKEFTEIMGPDRFEPDLFRIFRYPRAIPQYELSSGERFRTISRVEKQNPGLLLRGNFQGGIGLADRIRQGRLAAGEIRGSE